MVPSRFSSKREIPKLQSSRKILLYPISFLSIRKRGNIIPRMKDRKLQPTKKSGEKMIEEIDQGEPDRNRNQNLDPIEVTDNRIEESSTEKDKMMKV